MNAFTIPVVVCVFFGNGILGCAGETLCFFDAVK